MKDFLCGEEVTQEVSLAFLLFVLHFKITTIIIIILIIKEIKKTLLYINALLERRRTTDTQQTNMAAQSDPPVPSVFISHSAYFCHDVKLLIKKKKEKNERNILCIFLSIFFFVPSVSSLLLSL